MLDNAAREEDRGILIYEAVIHVNDSRVAPTKLELKFCPTLAAAMSWHHEAPVVIRLEGSPARWLGTVGIKPPHAPYLWANMTRLSRSGVPADTQPVSELLHHCGLGSGDRIPVRVDHNGDLVLNVELPEERSGRLVGSYP